MVIPFNTKFFARLYPEEYLASGRWYRLFMIATTLTWLAISVGLLRITVPTFDVSQMTPPDIYFTVCFVYLLGWFAVCTQSFLRWMLGNWNRGRGAS